MRREQFRMQPITRAMDSRSVHRADSEWPSHHSSSVRAGAVCKRRHTAHVNHCTRLAVRVQCDAFVSVVLVVCARACRT